MKAALFWDIDGTLLTTARAGVFALEEALLEVTGRDIDLQGVVASGLTEHEVASVVFATADVEADDALTERFLRAYEQHLPGSLHRRCGRVMSGVREVLEDLAPRNDVRSFLLTGNTPAGARAKLAHYGLDGFFTDGAFCIGPGSRDEIARRALPLASGADRVYVIGDTPHDIACGKAIGALTVAVGTGSHSLDELAAHDPWRLLSELPPPPAFRELIGVD